MSFDLWPHQQKAIAEAYESFRAGNTRVLVQMPTGAGKSATLGKIVKDGSDRGRRVFVVAHTEDLTAQLLGTLRRYEIYAGLIQSGHPAIDAQVQVCSVKTLANRLNWFEEREPNLIVIDEAHHAVAATYLKVCAAFPSAKLLGFTATPCRTDGKGLGDLFQSLISGPQIHELVRDGFLVEPRYLVGQSVIGDSLVPVTSSGKEDLKKLDAIVREVNLDGDLVLERQRLAADLQTIVFCLDRFHGKRVLQKYLEAGVKADYVDGETKNRGDIFKAFSEERIQVLVNVNVVTEGVDLPNCRCIQAARPTKSLALYCQMVGRGIRKHPDKTDCLILDHAGWFNEFGSVMEPRDWTLQTSKAKKPRQLSIDLPTDPIELQTLILTRKIQLEEAVWAGIPSSLGWLKSLHELNKTRKERNYKPYWVVSRLQKEYPELDLSAYKIIGRELGYHHAWAKHQVGEGLQGSIC